MPASHDPALRRVGGRYLSNLFNILDWTRFTMITLAVLTRYRILQDTSRDFNLDTELFVNTETVQVYSRQYDVFISLITLLTLFSTIQYFELNERTQILKSTMSKAALDLGPFSLIFFLFYCIYALVGMYLLGPSIENFSDYPKALYSSFDMMNANYPMSDLEPAIPNGDTVKNLSVVFYYYSFIGFHFFILLNVVIAMVCACPCSCNSFVVITTPPAGLL